MRLRPQPKTIFLCAAGCVLAGASGLALADYAQGSAFSFYKQAPSYWPEYARSEAPSTDWAYPVDPVAIQSAALGTRPNAVDAVYRDEGSEPLPKVEPLPRERRPLREEAEDLSAEAPLADVEYVIPAESGSWAEPAEPRRAAAEERPQPASAPPRAAEPADSAETISS
jgi:hypothetical protein